MNTDGDAQTQRDIGSLSAKVEHLGDEMAEIREDVKAIRSVIDQSRGGVKVMLAAASAGGAVTALLAELGLKTLLK
jgi:alpha-beta hydrolase superfamily lysophospholipase